MKEHSLGKKRLAPEILGRNGIKELRLVRVEHPARRDTKEKHRKKRTDDHNITPKVALRHCRNILLSIDVAPGIRVINIVVVSTRGGRMSIVRTDRRSMNVSGGSASTMGSTEGLPRGGRREVIGKWRRHWTD